MQGSHRPPSSSILLGRSTLLGSLALVALTCATLEVTLADDPPPPEAGGLAIPVSGSNVYSIPEEHEVEIWTGHLGGDCRPKRLTTAQLFDPQRAIQTSDDGSTLAYLTSSGVSFERPDGFKMSRARLQGGFHPGVAAAAQLVLSRTGRRAAYVTHEGAAELLRTTLWTVDLGAGSAPGPLPAPTVKPRRVKRSAPGVHVLPVGWSPSGESLIYLEQTPVRGHFVSVLIVRDVRAQTEGEIDRCLGQIDFALPFQTGPSAGTYGVLVGRGAQVRWVYPNGAPDEVLRSPEGTPLIGQGIQEIAASPSQPLDLAIRMGWPSLQADGKVQSGVYRIRGDRAQQITTGRGYTSLSYGPQGTLSIMDTNSITLFAAKSETTLAFADRDEKTVAIRASDWHSSERMLAIALEDEVLVLDLNGNLPDDAQRRSGWSEFVGLRAPGSPKPTLHRAFRLAKGSQQRITSVLWHGGRLVWTLQKASQAGLTR